MMRAIWYRRFPFGTRDRLKDLLGKAKGVPKTANGRGSAIAGISAKIAF